MSYDSRVSSLMQPSYAQRHILLEQCESSGESEDEAFRNGYVIVTTLEGNFKVALQIDRHAIILEDFTDADVVSIEKLKLCTTLIHLEFQ